MRTFFTFIYSLFFSCLIQAQEVITLTDDSEILYLSSGIDIAIDPTGLLTIDDITASDVVFKNTPFPFNGGYTRDTHWFRFTVQKSAPKSDSKNTKNISSFLLAAGPTYIDKLTLYSPSTKNESSYTVQVAGDTIAANQHPLGLIYGPYTFSITLTDNEPQTLYLKMQGNDDSTLQLILSSRDQLAKINNLDMLLSGFILGALTLISINAFIMWRWLKQPIYLPIIGYAIVIIIHKVMLSGIIARYLLPDSPNIMNLVDPLSISFHSLCSITFFIMYYDSKHSFPRLHYFFLSFLIFTIVTIFSIPLGYYLYFAPYLFLFALMLLPSLLFVSWKVAQTGSVGSQSVFIGTTIYVAILSIAILSALGAIPFYPMIMNAPAIASLVFLFSMQQGMHRQVNQFEAEKLVAEIAASKANKKANEEIQRRHEQSTFMTMVAHEIHTPLAVIDSAIQTIEMSSPTLSPFISERHNRIQNSVSRLSQLLENTLDAESHDSRPLQPKIESINTEPFILNCLQESLPKTRPYTLNISPDCTINADPNLFKHIISNLLVNAKKYSPNDSTIHISIHEQEKNAQIGTLFSIQNNHYSNVPIDPSRWLNKYFRQTETPNINGFGLGLYLVHKIIDAHQGDINIDIKPTPSVSNWLVTVNVWLPIDTTQVEGL
ncbi:sensor histidine kinase [Marinomonas transparens]|uniref:histidine kinase n=1 Tax=Marinomonas transparens TaxID=2795388 RepID=A0A934MVR1_9GAMM|nr:sensor histidine kinase [Marinomonas transparens]MBJ7537324.1 sensor histidine kinase [Marinomonas transparens]